MREGKKVPEKSDKGRHIHIIHVRKSQAIALSSVMAALMFFGFSNQAYANQLDALLLPDVDRSKAEIAGVRFIEIKYPRGSSLSSLLDGKNERVGFTANGTFNSTDASGIGRVIQAVNNAILTENQSPVIIENASLRYFATVKGYPERALLAFTTEFEPTIAKYVLQKSGENNQPAIVDLDWRNVVVREPLLITTQEYGTIDVNRPSGLVKLLFPELAEKISGSEAREIMEDPIMNFDRFGLPMKSWHFLFDVTGKQLERYGVFRPGEGATVSIHSIGESSFREGTYLPVEKDATVMIDEAEVIIHASTPPPSGQITIAGYSDVKEEGGAEFALVYPDSPGSFGLDFLGFQFQVLMALAGMMAAIAFFVLFKSRK
jgi:hypothetical protein